MRMSTLPFSTFSHDFFCSLAVRKREIISMLNGKCGEAPLEGLEVLEGEHGGGREDGDLLVVADGLESGAHGDFGFAVADVAAEQAIHGRGGLHVALDVGDGRDLVVGLVEFEGVLELALPLAVGGEGVALRHFALRVELEELVGHVAHGLLDARLGLGPLLRCPGGSGAAGRLRRSGTSAPGRGA